MPERQLLSAGRKANLVSLPDYFFTGVVPKIQDLAELKTVLCVSYLVLQKPEHQQSVPYRELKARSSELLPDLDDEALRRALDLAVEHGALSRSTTNVSGRTEDVYSLAYPAGQPPSTNIFTLYEQNIGIITPIIAEELKEAEKLYPPQWIRDAFREAVSLNKRSWRYIARVLERWASEGRDSGEYQRDTKKGGPNKYIRGRYGHLVKR